MEVIAAIEKRQTVRKFLSTAVPEEILIRLLSLATRAPSEWNLQPWRWIVVRKPKNRKKLFECAYEQKQLKTAPVAIIACADPFAWERAPQAVDEMIALSRLKPEEKEEKVSFMLDDYGTSELRRREFALKCTFLAIENILLAAEQFGLATNCMGGFEETRVKEAFNIPPHWMVAALIAVGFPAEQPPRTPRQCLDTITFEEKFGAPWNICKRASQWRQMARKEMFVVDVRSPKNGRWAGRLISRHVAFLKRLQRQGKLISAGPFADGRRGFMIVDARSMQEAEKIAKQNPLVADGKAKFQIHRWVQNF